MHFVKARLHILAKCSPVGGQIRSTLDLDWVNSIVCRLGGQIRFNSFAWLVASSYRVRGEQAVVTVDWDLFFFFFFNLIKASQRQRAHFILLDGPSCPADIWCTVAMIRGDICGSFVPCVSLSRLQFLMISVDSWEGKAEQARARCLAWRYYVFLPLCILSLGLAGNYINCNSDQSSQKT